MNDTLDEDDSELIGEALPRAGGRPTRRERARRRILRGTAVLPGFVTILNGLSGLLAIHFATREAFGTLSAAHMSDLASAAWLLALAMVFDMLDGRLARITRHTTDFGAQLDSLCDAISFGVAPAVLMHSMVVPALRELGALGHDWHLERIVWSVSAMYVACTVLRLARFNVETEAGEAAHMSFRGLPTPGAAAAIAALTLLFEWLTRLLGVWDAGGAWQGRPWLLAAMSIVSLGVAACVALLMVSRFRYAHLVNQYVRGKKPFSYLVKALVITLALVWQPFVTMAVVACAYALSGPVRFAWVRFRPGGRSNEKHRQ